MYIRFSDSASFIRKWEEKRALKIGLWRLLPSSFRFFVLTMVFVPGLTRQYRPLLSEAKKEARRSPDGLMQNPRFLPTRKISAALKYEEGKKSYVTAGEMQRKHFFPFPPFLCIRCGDQRARKTKGKRDMGENGKISRQTLDTFLSFAERGRNRSPLRSPSRCHPKYAYFTVVV